MTARSALKRAIGRVALVPPFAARTRRALLGRLNVVYLHYVGDVRPYYADFYVGTTLEQLDADLTTLARHFEFCSLRDLVDSNGRRSDDGVPRLVVTFDDGFDLMRNGAVDVLERHGVRATTFVVTSTLDNANLMWRHKLSAIRALRDESLYASKYNQLMAKAGLPLVTDAASLMPASEAWPMDKKEELADEFWAACGMPSLADFLDEERPYFTPAGLREWTERGHGVGLHTHSHPFCSRLGPDAVEPEIVAPASRLRRELALEFLPFSYPFGARLGAGTERELFERGTFDCAFGIEGFAARGTAPFRLERACIEGELAYAVFGLAFLGRPRPG